MSEELDFYPKRENESPKHKEKGEYRRFSGELKVKTFFLPDGSESKLQYYGSSIEGCDLFCGQCQHWNTIKNESVFFGVVGDCKKCGESWIEK